MSLFFDKINAILASLYQKLTITDKERTLKKLCAQLPLAKTIPTELLKQLAGSLHELSPNTLIFSQGEESKEVYFILSGAVEVYLENVDQSITVMMGPDQFFGERGVLTQTKRAGTAITRSHVALLKINGQIFYDLYWAVPKLQKHIKTMLRVYKIPQHGLVTSTKGSIFNLDAVVTHYAMENRKISASHVIGKDIFYIEQMAVPRIDQVIYYQKNFSVFRKIKIADNKIVSLLCIGAWDQSGLTCSRLLDQTPIESWQLKLFAATGDIDDRLTTPNPQEILCYCMNLSYGTIQRAIHNGMNDFEQLSSYTGAGTVCGACVYKINQLLGNPAISLAYIDQIISVNAKTRIYRFKSHQFNMASHQPGQHIILQAYIDQQWTQRPYTLISPPASHYYEIIVKLEDTGHFSNWLFNKANKDSLFRISAPQGKFIVNLSSKKTAVFFAGGIGIAPAVAAMRCFNQHTQMKLHIDYSAYRDESFLFVEEFQQTMEKNPNFSVYFRATDREGMLTRSAVVEILKNFPDAEYFICGHKEYETAVVKFLEEAGVEQHRIKYEIFLYANQSEYRK